MSLKCRCPTLPPVSESPGAVVAWDEGMKRMADDLRGPKVRLRLPISLSDLHVACANMHVAIASLANAVVTNGRDNAEADTIRHMAIAAELIWQHDEEDEATRAQDAVKPVGENAEGQSADDLEAWLAALPVSGDEAWEAWIGRMAGEVEAEFAAHKPGEETVSLGLRAVFAVLEDDANDLQTVSPIFTSPTTGHLSVRIAWSAAGYRRAAQAAKDWALSAPY